jgi:Coenzyme F420-dependent N5,N10-methylene tetrahydromethanopterin reductase and related flavin-dependent oxidoreductases
LVWQSVIRAHIWSAGRTVQRAEELGYDSVWSAEAYGSDAITPLAFLAGKTNRIKLGTGIMQLGRANASQRRHVGRQH